MIKWKVILHHLRNFDIFGVNLIFAYNQKYSYKTIFGSILTIVLSTLLIFKLIIEIQNLIMKQKLDIYISEIPAIDDSIKFQDIEIAVCPLFNIIYQKNMDDIFRFSYSYKNDKREIMYSANLTKDSCTKLFQIGDGHYHQTKDYCHCVKFDDQFSFNITKNSSLFSDSFISIKAEANFGLVETSIKKNNSQDIIVRTVLFLYQSNYVNTSDYFNLINNYETGTYDTMDDGSSVTINMGVNKIQVDIIDDIFTFGLVDPDTDSNYTYSIERKDSQIYDLDDSVVYSEINYNLRHNGIISLYQLDTFDIEGFLALFGGYFQVFFVLFGMVSNFINYKALDRNIENTFKKNTKTIDKLLKEIDEAIMQLVNENVHLTLKLKPQKADQNNDKMFDRNEISQTHNKNEINSPGFQKLFKNERPPENLILINNNYNNPSLNFSERRISSHNIDNRASIFQQQVKTINHNEDYYKEIKNDFIAQLDYGKFYNLVKEIKLIKFFLMDIESLRWVYKLESYPFSIDKFEHFIQEKHENQVDSQNDDNLCSIQKKLKLLKDFFLFFNKQ